MTTTCKHTVYKAENDKGVIELNTEVKPNQKNYTPGVLGDDPFLRDMNKWNANTIKAEVSDKATFELFIINSKTPKWEPDSFKKHAEFGIDILPLMDRIELNLVYKFYEGNYYGKCGNCKQKFTGAKRQPLCKKCCDSIYIATLKPVSDSGKYARPFLNEVSPKPVLENMPEEKQTQGQAIKFLEQKGIKDTLFINEVWSKYGLSNLLTEFSAAKDQRIAELEKENKRWQQDYSDLQMRNIELKCKADNLANRAEQCISGNLNGGMHLEKALTEYNESEVKDCDHDYIPVGEYEQNGSFYCKKCKHKI